MLNAKVNNWGVEFSDFIIRFKFIKAVKNKLPDTLSRLINLELTESNAPEKEGYEYGYAMFEQLLDDHVDSIKHEPVPPINISSISAKSDKIVQKDNNVNT